MQDANTNPSSFASPDSFWSRQIDFSFTPLVVLGVAGFIAGAAALAPEFAESALRKSDDFRKLVHLENDATALIEKAQKTAESRMREADERLNAQLATIQRNEAKDKQNKAERLLAARKTLSELGGAGSEPQANDSSSKIDAKGEYNLFMTWLQDCRPEEYAALMGEREKKDALAERLEARRVELQKSGTKPSADVVFKAIEKEMKAAEKELADRTTALETTYFNQEIAASASKIKEELAGSGEHPGLSELTKRVKSACDMVFADAQTKLKTL